MSGHKLNIIDGMTNKIISPVTPVVILSVKISHDHTICFFNPTVLFSVILSIFTENMFLSIYLKMYFTVQLITSVMLSVKVIHYRTI